MVRAATTVKTIYCGPSFMFLLPTFVLIIFLVRSQIYVMASKTVTLCIFFYGLVIGIPIYVLIMATEDILSGTLIQSSVVIILYSTGDFLGKVFGSFLVRWIKLPASVLVSSLLWLASWLLVVLGEDANIRLVGVFILGMAEGLSTAIGLCVLSQYDDIERNTSAFEAGNSAITTFIVGFLYTGSTVWLCISPRLTFAVVYFLALFQVLIYVILNHGPLKKFQIQDADIKYMELHFEEEAESNAKPRMPRLYYHLTFLYKALPFTNYFFLGALLNRFVNTSVITSLTFPLAPFRIRDHFQYYTYTNDIGRILGACDILLVSFLCPSWLDIFRFRRIWILILLSLGHLLFFLFASWFRFLPNVYIVLVLCVTHGIVTSAIFVRSLSLAGSNFSSTSERSLTYIFCHAAASLGFICAGLIGVDVEENLRQHCTNELFLGEYCLARFTSSLGWSTNWQCT